jgi:hypothetical protein
MSERKELSDGDTVILRQFKNLSGHLSSCVVKLFVDEAINGFNGFREVFAIHTTLPSSLGDFSIDIASRNQVACCVAEYL